MSKRDIKLYIEDINESIRKIEKYTKDLSLDDFKKNIMAVDAVVRNLSVIGEAVKNIPEEVKAKHPNIPWQEIIGMRNKITHEYFGVDIDILWETIKKDIPAFAKQINQLQANI